MYRQLLESQSAWNMNILIRGLFYLADTYKRYFDAKGLKMKVNCK